MTDWTQAADELRLIITSDPKVHAAWSEDGVAAALRVVAEQRDEARRVARRYFRVITENDCPDPELTDAEQHNHPWLMERTDGEA